MELKEADTIRTVEKLRELYENPGELVIKKEKTCLDQYSRRFLELSPFAVIATSDKNGKLDSSPRGDFPGFIRSIDDKTIAIPDRPGNNRVDSLINIIKNPQIGILSLVPGFDECLRINGNACLVTSMELLSQFEHNGKMPKSVILVSIEEIFFHCGKAIIRSGLCKAELKVDRSAMLSLGRILMAQIDPQKSEKEIIEVEQYIEDRAKNTLY